MVYTGIVLANKLRYDNVSARRWEGAILGRDMLIMEVENEDTYVCDVYRAAPGCRIISRG
jgi:hypothetical protein